MEKKRCFKKELSCWKNAPLSSSRSVGVRDIRGAIKNFAAPIPRIETLRGDEARQGGFTLIELLVVVLIIGILAAVAVPQYQKAVDKSRLVQLIAFNKAIREAQERYYMANGSYTNDLNVLDVGFAAEETAVHYWEMADGTGFYLASNGTDQSVTTFSPFLSGFSLRSVYNHAGQGDSRDGRMLCYADKNNARANRACKTVGANCTSVDDTRNVCLVSKQ